MATPLKKLYNKEFYRTFCTIGKKYIPGFDSSSFTKKIFRTGWEEKELKDRMKHTALVLHEYMPADFSKSANLIRQMIAQLKSDQLHRQALQYMFLPEYIEKFGIRDFEISVSLMEEVTTFTSCEFAVRPFLIEYGDRMLNEMLLWSRHENHHVRRLASEGSRPRLPWAMAVPALKKDPSGTLPILENLKYDPSEYVRRSVANHLNDISKDHPSLVLSILKQWKGKSNDIDALLKHACRTLLKQGDPVALKLFGHVKNDSIKCTGFALSDVEVKVPEKLNFSFTVINEDRRPHKIRLEYAVYYLLKNGSHSKKVFKISERLLEAGEKVTISRNHSFRLITTRTYYSGKQMLSVIVNGDESKPKTFYLGNA